MTDYLDQAAVGALFGVSRDTVARWRVRYRDTHPCPEPDVIIGRSPGWVKDRAQEWRDWAASRTGQGVGGGRPAKTTEGDQACV